MALSLALPACGPRSETPQDVGADPGVEIGADGVRIPAGDDSGIEVSPLPPLGGAAASVQQGESPE